MIKNYTYNILFIIIILFFWFSPLALSSTGSPKAKFDIFHRKSVIVDIVDAGNTLWFATYGQGLYAYNKQDGSWEIYNTQEKTADNDFYYCVAASDNFIWAGSSDGLFIYDRKRKSWKKRKFAVGGEYGNWIRSLYYDKAKDVLWIGRFKFLSRLDVKKQKWDDFDLTINKDDKTNNIKIIRPDGENYLWIGTEGGMFFYDKRKDPNQKSSFEFFSNNGNGFRGDGESVSIAEIFTEKNYVWIGTEEFITEERPKFNVGGIYRFNRKAGWQKFDKRTGLTANGIYCLTRVGNHIWAGVYQFDRNLKKEIPKGLVIFNRFNGKPLKFNLDEIQLTTNTISALYFDGSYLWIGTDDGIWRLSFTAPFASMAKRSDHLKK